MPSQNQPYNKVDKNQIKDIASNIHDNVVGWRRHIHQYPELSYEEEKTSAYIAQQLDEMGIAYQRNVGGHGIVATIYAQNGSDDVVALRADMDALPITEENAVSYASINEGVMHACGHDVHTANLLGVAKVLKSYENDLPHHIRLIFQPAEERLPGGASLMIKDGVLKNPVPKYIIGFHVFPQMEVGHVGMRPGMYMASTDEIYITVKGKGGHAAIPHFNVDTVVVTAHIITALQTIVSRSSDPTIPSVLSFGKINSTGGATNIIPDEVKMEGTFRTMDETWREQAHGLIKERARQVAASFGATCEVTILKGYPVLMNDEKITKHAFAKASEILGEDRVHTLPIRMTAEDFAYYSHEIPACFIRIGTSNASKNIGAPLHTSRFDVDEDCFKTSIPLMAYLAMQPLDQE